MRAHSDIMCTTSEGKKSGHVGKTGRDTSRKRCTQLPSTTPRPKRGEGENRGCGRVPALAYTQVKWNKRNMGSYR